MSPIRDIKRLPGKFEGVPRLDEEFDNIYKELNTVINEAALKDTSKDLFEIQKYDNQLKINRDTATLGDVVDFVATLAIKLGELGLIKTEKRN